MHRKNSHDKNVCRSFQDAPDTAVVVNEAWKDYQNRHPDEKLNPLAVVIPAYNEENNIGQVLDEIPDQIGHMAVSRIVVDDSSGDGTTAIARRHGALVCRLTANRGQGVALRLGYRIAREGGARYIATLDADGQWDPADLTAMIALLEASSVDLVVGSRRLQKSAHTAPFRNEHLQVFAWLTSRLTGVRLTDATSGLRLMRAELTDAVRQTQPQYQAAEFLIGTLLQGFRVAEVPIIMRERISGTSTKGADLARVPRYFWVILSTWWREFSSHYKAQLLVSSGDSTRYQGSKLLASN